MRTVLAASIASCLVGLIACGHRAPPVSAFVSPSLEPQADAQAHSSFPEGQRTGAPLVGTSYGPDEGTDWMVPLVAGQCYAFGYAADPTVARFSMYIWDPSNHRLDSSRGRPGQGVFNHCAKMNGMYRLQGKVVEGAGHFVVVTYTKAGEPPPVVAAPVAPPDLTTLIEAQAASAAPGAVRVGEFYVGIGDQTDWYTPMVPGKCYWIIGAGEAGKVKSLYTYLWDPRMSRITENRSDTPVSMVGYCPTVPGMYKFEAKVNSGKGEYKVGVYAR
jgi:hypothetical protein